MSNDQISSEFLEMLILVDDNNQYFEELLQKDRPFAISALLSIMRHFNGDFHAGRYNNMVVYSYIEMINSENEIVPDELWKILQVLAYTDDTQQYSFLEIVSNSPVIEACLKYHPEDSPKE